ncbi:DsbC family protein [Corticibacter populi]|uniref:Thiol:disulfide interchange protein n=1 Tax=Corticibacter populi TaxID=1550736 RepID=A0A3M6QV47_9BURK|nr:DsbC family protein [Corticibacter populi]RMX06897.1 DsbC family protein [Corticibacter populi]
MVTLVPLAAQAADDAQPSTEALRATLGQRIPQLQGIDQVSPTPMSGLYEVRVGTDVFYTDATGDFLIQGELFDTQAKRNITEDRIRALTAIDYQKLPFEDAFTVVRGDGSRQIAVFEDPNCGYCKRFERDMLNLDNITVHVFLYPILSPDSFEKSRDIWCAKDTAAAWSQWMLGDTKPSAEKGSCENQDALQRNLAFGRQYKITGTPTIIFEDGTRVPGAVPAQQIEQKLQNLDKAS